MPGSGQKPNGNCLVMERGEGWDSAPVKIGPAMTVWTAQGYLMDSISKK